MTMMYNAPHMYKLIGKDGKEYASERKGQFGGHRGLKIYGKLDCPSALRHIAAGEYVKQRVFFADEETALAAGYRPCGVCMKEHYRLWKGGRLMTHALEASPILNESVICMVRLANGKTKRLAADRLKDTPIPEMLKQRRIEDFQIKIEEDNCAITLTGESCQWGYTMVWDYVQDQLVHLTNTPFAVSSVIFGSRLVNMYLVQYWGHPADLWYSIAPLELIDPDYEPEKVPLTISLDESVKGSAGCEVYQKNGELFFRAGDQEERIKKLSI
ncbi:MAG: hypothetical protein ACI3XJ_01345 [Oscillospiraceae bacterium]